jgi:hypothetical protein
MAPAFVASIEAVNASIVAPPNNNSKTGQSGGGTSINTTGATLLVAVLRSNGSTPTITDSASNTWSLGTVFTIGGVSRVRLAWVINPTTSTTHTFNPNALEGSAEIFAFSGSGSWSLTTVSGATSSTSGTSVTTRSISTSANDLVIAGLSSNASQSAGTINNGFDGGISGGPAGTALPQRLSGTPEVGMGGYLISSGGSISATFTTSVSNADWIWVIGGFTLTPAGAARNIVLMILEG